MMKLAIGLPKQVADSKDKHDARALFQEAKGVAGKRPETLITDGLNHTMMHLTRYSINAQIRCLSM